MTAGIQPAFWSWPIFCRSAESRCASMALTPVIHISVIHGVRTNSALAKGEPIAYHLKIDTGMWPSGHARKRRRHRRDIAGNRAFVSKV